jgi:hypothetical protein
MVYIPGMSYMFMSSCNPSTTLISIQIISPISPLSHTHTHTHANTHTHTYTPTHTHTHTHTYTHIHTQTHIHTYNLYPLQCRDCNRITRFPRYNNPSQLLKSRTGRCGEFANVFCLLLRSLHLDARYVLDFTDHVWCEVWMPGLRRYVCVCVCMYVCVYVYMYVCGYVRVCVCVFV